MGEQQCLGGGGEGSKSGVAESHEYIIYYLWIENFHKVRAVQGDLEIWKMISGLGNCWEILKIQKVTEIWRN